jgi:hypothetical protein
MIKSIAIAIIFQYIDFGNVYTYLVFYNEISISKHYCGIFLHFLQILEQIQASKFSIAWALISTMNREIKISTYVSSLGILSPWSRNPGVIQAPSSQQPCVLGFQMLFAIYTKMWIRVILNTAYFHVTEARQTELLPSFQLVCGPCLSFPSWILSQLSIHS